MQGSGSNQKELSFFCDETNIDIIPLAFVDIFPAQGDGLPGQDFGNACNGLPLFTPGPGYPLGDVDTSNDHLYKNCSAVQTGIPYCQSKGKKILLSLGGGTDTYQLTGAADGEYFADLLWGMYGPFPNSVTNQAWIDAGSPRPLDFEVTGNNPEDYINVDGFDLDIEVSAIGINFCVVMHLTGSNFR